jgi:outer membrane protein assembly factor BamA
MLNNLLKYSATLFILFVCNSSLSASIDSSTVFLSDISTVDSIAIRGNNITEDFIIRRELTIEVGDKINKKIIDFNKERIFSLGLFSKVDLFTEINDVDTLLVIDVKESWYIYPIPFLYLRGGDFENSSYGINFLYKNFRGRNETLRTILSFGYNPNYRISYFNPVLFSKPDISFSFGLGYLKSSNRSEKAEILFEKDFEYKIYSSYLIVGKRIDQFNEFQIVSEFRYVETPEKYIPEINGSKDRIDNNLSLGINYIFDSRDLKQHPKSGFLASIYYTHFGFEIDDIDYNLFRLDFREYVRLFNELTFKWRLDYRHTFGKKVPLYDYSFLGVGDYIRGHRGDDQEGNNFILSSFEFNHPIVEEWNISLDIPFLPKRLTSARIGIHANVFFDTGLAYNNGETWKLSDFQSGWGVGITILALPFNAFRIEYAFDEVKNGELIFGSGFSF